MSGHVSAGVHLIEARNFFYHPDTLTAAVGDTVRFLWIEGNHPTESTTGAWTTFPLDFANTSYDWVPTATGFYPYICTVHAGVGMTGSITVTSSVPPCAPDQPPQGLVSTPSPTSVNLSWDILPNAVLYQVVGRELGMTGMKRRTTTVNAISISGLTPSTAYGWRVRALCGGTDEVTVYSMADTFSTSPAPASDGLRVHAGSDRILIRWEDGAPDVRQVEWLDLAGRLYAVRRLAPGETEVGIRAPEGLSAGLYVIAARGEGGVRSQVLEWPSR